MSTSEPGSHLALEWRAELRALSEQYARAADRRDGPAFAEVFHRDARLEVHNPVGAGVPAVRSGEELAAIPDRLRRYDTTFHMLGQSTYTAAPDHDHATGEVYCMAHHVTRDDSSASDHVMFIRYDDEYRRDPALGWRIAVRRVLVDFTEIRPLG